MPGDVSIQTSHTITSNDVKKLGRDGMPATANPEKLDRSVGACVLTNQDDLRAEGIGGRRKSSTAIVGKEYPAIFCPVLLGRYIHKFSSLCGAANHHAVPGTSLIVRKQHNSLPFSGPRA
jgi:hypothetical protein